ncbi:SDR family oxidoreductase [Streptomyces rubiginosohelvolus]|uniref:SDR family oxidoreductase n=1 Tax=Streptomyces TaxID=1883 RepID=UPI003AABC282
MSWTWASPAPSSVRHSCGPAHGCGADVDIANAVAYLAGPDAQWITGTTLAVDGGYTACGLFVRYGFFRTLRPLPSATAAGRGRRSGRRRATSA